MRAIVFGVIFSLSALVAGSGVAVASKCDVGIDKAAAKKVGCICKAITKGSDLATAIAACSPKFGPACTKAQSAGDCVVQTGTCDNKETEADDAANTLCNGSPSGAFLN